MYKLFEFRDENGRIVAEVPIIVYDGQKTREIIDTLLPEIVEKSVGTLIRSLLIASDSARNEGPFVLHQDGVAIRLTIEPTPSQKTHNHQTPHREPPHQDANFPFDKMN